ncbi:DUF300-domain-containing protein [Lentinus tigrinus ALCF2SS1-6]|uniref:DUF300-domain-containing protein n=1 Tax=Lentinus tigrinus ALCF2SS1-6 TaxID=1328759 RepID=A0A5C2SK13_9APHY|nr:DUF300-domain-containing protein [Lentinus tigrinus ALCF2SS1-6]
MAEIVNGRCHVEKASLNSPPLIQHGKIVIQYHHIGWMVCSALTLVAMGVSFWLINKHLRWYTNKYEQRYIVRILFMVPLYALISTASYFWWNHSTPLLLLRDCYESTVLTAFFYLLLLYLSPDPHEQKEIFRKNGLSRQNDKERRRRGESVQKWMFPLGFVRYKPEDGLYFLQLMKWGVLQYCVVRPGTTLAAVILDYAGLYCEDSWGLGWGHIYITLVVSISVSIAMYCLIQLYFAVKVELAPQKPLLKLFAIKAVVFLTFWQATFLSVLTLFGIVKDTPYMTADNINIGIGAILETFEMALFAMLHVKAFSYKPYCTGDGPTPRWRSLVHAMNFKETGREIWVGMIYMMRKSRGHEVDTQARRQAALENVFGRSRFAIYREANNDHDSKAAASEKNLGVTIEVEEELLIDDERQWIGVGNDYIYGLGYQAKRQRERSEGLESQIEKELVMRGYTLRGLGSGGAYAPIVDAEAAPTPGHQHGQASWWRRMYNRLSQSGPDAEDETTTSPARRLSSRTEDDYNDPPPPSAIRPKRKPPPPLDPPLLFTSSPDARSDTRMGFLGAPALLTPPLASPSTQSMLADSFLDRAFAASVEPGSSADSHHTRVRLGATPPQPRTPVVVDLPAEAPAALIVPPAPPAVTRNATASTSPPHVHRAPLPSRGEPRGRRRSHRRDAAQFYPEPGNYSLSPLQQSPPQCPPLQRATAAYSRGTRRNSATPQYPPQYTPVNRYTPTRDRIVLPAPLASGASDSPATPSSQTFSSPMQHSPPRLTGSPPPPPPPRDPRRLSNAAHTPPYWNVRR